MCACLRSCLCRTLRVPLGRKNKGAKKKFVVSKLSIRRTSRVYMAARTLSLPCCGMRSPVCMKGKMSLLSKALRDQRRCFAHTTVRGQKSLVTSSCSRICIQRFAKKSIIDWSSGQTSGQETLRPQSNSKSLHCAGDSSSPSQRVPSLTFLSSPKFSSSPDLTRESSLPFFKNALAPSLFLSPVYIRSERSG